MSGFLFSEVKTIEETEAWNEYAKETRLWAGTSNYFDVESRAWAKLLCKLAALQFSPGEGRPAEH